MVKAICYPGNAIQVSDYLVNARIRLFIFDNRIEIISPGLPKNEPINDIENQILEFIGSNPKITYDELAHLTRKGRSSIMRIIAELKAAGRLERVGPKKGGHWEIIG